MKTSKIMEDTKLNNHYKKEKVKHKLALFHIEQKPKRKQENKKKK
jgi:hypothetical protein